MSVMKPLALVKSYFNVDRNIINYNQDNFIFYVYILMLPVLSIIYFHELKSLINTTVLSCLYDAVMFVAGVRIDGLN